MKDPIRTKQALKFGVEATLTTGGTLNVTVDSESGSSPLYVLNNTVTWFNNQSITLTWVNNSSNNRVVDKFRVRLVQIRCTAVWQVFGVDNH
jgi:hypothetical protein